MHFVLAIVITAIAVFAIGGPAETSPAVGAVSQCVAPDPAPGSPEPVGDACSVPGSVPAPALAAGLLAGDVITAVDGVAISERTALTDALRGAPGTPVALTVDRDGQALQVSLVPAAVDRYVFDDAGEITGLETAGTIGISVQQRLGTERLGPVESLDATGDLLYGYVDGVWTTFTEKLGSITQLYSDDRDPAGFIGVVGAGRISGEVATAPEWSNGYKALTFLILIAGLNLFVGVFNLLPLLPLDGGHLAVLGFEQARDKVRRRFGYTGAVQRVDLTKLLPVTYVVVFVFAFATLFIMGADIVNPIRITS